MLIGGWRLRVGRVLLAMGALTLGMPFSGDVRMDVVAPADSDRAT